GPAPRRRLAAARAAPGALRAPGDAQLRRAVREGAPAPGLEGPVPPRQPRQLLVRPRVHRLRRGGGPAALAQAGAREDRGDLQLGLPPDARAARQTAGRAAGGGDADDRLHGGPTAGVTATPVRHDPLAAWRPTPRTLLRVALLGGSVFVYPWLIDEALSHLGTRPVAAGLLVLALLG